MADHVEPDAEARFLAAASAHAKSTIEGGYRRANAEYDKLYAALNVLRLDRQEERKVLLEHYLDEDIGIALWCSHFLLPVDENKALAGLQRVANAGVRRISFDAKMDIKYWSKGTLKVL